MIDELLNEFRDAYAKHGGAICWIQATPAHKQPPNDSIGLVWLPPIQGHKQHEFWLSVHSDDRDAIRDFVTLASKGGAWLSPDFKHELCQGCLMEPAATWCVALMRLAIDRGHTEPDWWILLDGHFFESIPEWMRPFAASVELLERTEATAGDPADDGQVLDAATIPEADAGAGGDDEQPQDANHGQDAGDDGMTWQAVADELEARMQRGDKYTSHRNLAKAIGCGKHLVTKAFKEGSVELQEWASPKHRGASRRNLTPEAAAVTFGSTPQKREPNPADIIEQADIERALAYMIEQARPDERARIHGMTAAQKRELAELALRDPDTEEQALRYGAKPSG